MAINKKGIFFTIIAVSLVTVLIFSYIIYNEYRLRDKSLVIETRIDSMNDFLKDVETDIERGLFIAGFRGLLGINQNIIDKGQFVTNFPVLFNEIVLNGTLNGNSSPLANDSSFNLWIKKMQSQSLKLGIVLNVSQSDVWSAMVTPWIMAVYINATIRTEDVNSLASWVRNKTYWTSINIEGFEDPVFAIKSGGYYTRTIKRSPYKVFSDNKNDVSGLLDHVLKGYYIAYPAAPDYLMRLQGNLGNSSSGLGIESTVDIAALQAAIPAGGGFAGIIQNKSIIDHIYWSTWNPQSYRVNFTPAHIRLDNESQRLMFFNVWNITYTQI